MVARAKARKGLIDSVKGFMKRLSRKKSHRPKKMVFKSQENWLY